jgi:maleate cis-trans isomerase
MEPHAIALQAMSIGRVAIASYYGDELNEAIVRYFRRFDIDAVPFGGYRSGGTEQDLYTTSLPALDAVGSAQVYRYCRDGFVGLKRPVDGIYINGGGWDAIAAINELERDLGTRVVLAQAAELWLALRTLSIRPMVEDCGALLREDYRPPATTA